MQEILFKMARLYGLSIVESEKMVEAYSQLPNPTFELTKHLATLKMKPLRITIDIVPVANAIQSLPKNDRLILIASSLGDLSIDEIASALQISTDKVTAYKFQAKEKLLQITYYEELQQFLDQPEQINIQTLGMIKKQKEKKPMPKGQRYTMIGIASAFVITLLIWQLTRPTEETKGELIEPLVEIIDEEQPTQSTEPTLHAVNTYDGSIPFPHEKTLNIAKAVIYYQSNIFTSEISAEQIVFHEFFRGYAKVDYLQRLGYFMPENRLAHYYERAMAEFEYRRKNDATLPLLLNKLEELFGYTEEDYIEYYLFVTEQFTYLNELANSKDLFDVDSETNYEQFYEDLYTPYFLSVGYTLHEYDEKYEQYLEMSNISIEDTLVPLDYYDEDRLRYLSQSVYFYKKPDGNIILLEKAAYDTLNGGEAYLYELASTLKLEFNKLTFKQLQEAIDTTEISNEYLINYKEQAKLMIQLFIDSYTEEMAPMNLQPKTL